MEKQELQDALIQIKNDIAAKMDGMEKASKDEQLQLKSDVKALNDNLALIQKQLDSIATEQAKAAKAPTEKTKSFIQELKDSLQKDIAKLQEKGAKVSYEIKAFLEGNNASVTTGHTIPLPYRESGIGKPADRPPFLYELIGIRPTNSNVIEWVERKTRTDNSEFTAEGTATNAESVIGYQIASQAVKKISAFIKVSKESMNDIDFIMSEIREELITLVLLKLDAQILDGTTGATTFDGIEAHAQAFAPGYKVEVGITPTDFDVLAAAANQVMQNNYNANVCLISVKKWGQMRIARDGDGQYTLPMFVTNDGKTIEGMRVLMNTGVDDDDFMVFDSNKAALFVRQGLEVEIFDQNENDALADLKTVRASMRATLRIKNTDENAFVKGTFTAAKATLTNL